MDHGKISTGEALRADPFSLPATVESGGFGLSRLMSGALGELIRYFAASAVALGADAGMLIFATEVLGLHYLISATLGFTLGIVIIYAVSVRWVFAHRSLQDRNAERMIFLIVGLIGLGINDVVIFALTDGAGLAYTYSKIGAAALVFSFNFGARKLALFRAPASKQPERNA